MSTWVPRCSRLFCPPATKRPTETSTARRPICTKRPMPKASRRCCPARWARRNFSDKASCRRRPCSAARLRCHRWRPSRPPRRLRTRRHCLRWASAPHTWSPTPPAWRTCRMPWPIRMALSLCRPLALRPQRPATRCVRPCARTTCAAGRPSAPCCCVAGAQTRRCSMGSTPRSCRATGPRRLRRRHRQVC